MQTNLYKLTHHELLHLSLYSATVHVQESVSPPSCDGTSLKFVFNFSLNSSVRLKACRYMFKIVKSLMHY